MYSMQYFDRPSAAAPQRHVAASTLEDHGLILTNSTSNPNAALLKSSECVLLMSHLHWLASYVHISWVMLTMIIVMIAGGLARGTFSLEMAHQS